MAKNKTKDKQLQIRVSPWEKASIVKLAKQSGLSLSAWVLKKVLPDVYQEFQSLVAAIAMTGQEKYALAEMHDFLVQLDHESFKIAVAYRPEAQLSPLFLNYIAAMVEYAAKKKKIQSPHWTTKVEPLMEPYFASDLKSLRLHLLLNSPAPFRSRNIFIDASLGDRV